MNYYKRHAVDLVSPVAAASNNNLSRDRSYVHILATLVDLSQDSVQNKANTQAIECCVGTGNYIPVPRAGETNQVKRQWPSEEY